MITFGFFDSIDGDRKYSADDISNFFETLIPDGVMASPDDTFQVSESSGFTVKVSAGWGFIQRKWIHNDSDLFLTLDQPDVILDRGDRIVLRLNREARTIEIAVKRGTPGENPYAGIPELQRDETIWELCLAYVMVWHGREGITQNDIGDTRHDTNLCGKILGFDKIFELLNNVSDLQRKLENCRYYCNGQNDNITLPEFIASWSPSHPDGTLKIIGNFGINDETTEFESIPYSMIYENTTDFQVILDFSECSMIEAKPRSFAFFRNCHIKGLSVRYNENRLDDISDMNVLFGINAVFEDCHIYGSASGNEAFVKCYNLDSSRLIKCEANFSSENSLWGIMTAGDDTIISECSIEVTGTATNPVYGISASDHHCSGSKFKAVGYTAQGGSAGGNYSECLFEGYGEVNGYGFKVTISNDFHASNCTFRGYTRDEYTGNGYGLYGDKVSNILLQGINCSKKIAVGYDQTGSMVFNEGSGFYTGDFYEPPELPKSETIVTYTDFLPTRVMTQAEYDALESYGDNTLYVLT